MADLPSFERRYRLRPLTPAEIEEHERDVELAKALLEGVRREDGPNGLPDVNFLSCDTTPTEEEARAALARVLLSENIPSVVLWMLAGIFAPDGFRSGFFHPGQRRAVFKNRSKGHSNNQRNIEIAYRIYTLREAGMSYDDACEKVGGAAGFQDMRQIKRIYASFRGLFSAFGPLPPTKRRNRGG